MTKEQAEKLAGLFETSVLGAKADGGFVPFPATLGDVRILAERVTAIEVVATTFASPEHAVPSRVGVETR